jgi:hypothetical protein
MQAIQGNTLLSLQNVQAYLAENAATLGDLVSAETRKTLDDSIAELSEHATVQDGHTRVAKGATARQRAKRTALVRDHMRPIARIAELKLEDTPELLSLTLPRDRPPVERLAALADGMARAAEPHAALFIRAGCTPEFIQNLRTAADELLATLSDRAQSRSKVRTATSALRTKLVRAQKVVRAIDGFMMSALANDPDRLAGWKLVKRVPQPRSGAATARAASALALTPAPAQVLAPVSTPALAAAA